ncbi:hypothetical protein H6S82_06335 [Planktothrix sp. FACHB-1355]|uniref:Uncharacterized protein n=1 Tax=Aerosakkonema funiforme FACHB-1375 TaxID=2949571 RepID=A0A926ZG30_9CYAN|nr:MULTISPECIES: hypothetical protein [Oscillatoriales]MBD2181748.1 hypothetical protein [Aerosakkonema funiforme FACHB-1375]MBD3558472.1 hypothetical protein [Planktothrix sp. FACHB-1355]
MPENEEQQTPELSEWRLILEAANRNNVFCHCRTCSYEWVTSSEDVPCSRCGSTNVRYILCWQFPDD